MSTPGGNGVSIAGDWDDDDDERGGYEPDEPTPAPLFGCACENPLSVDTVCPSCIAYLEAQEREVAALTGPIPAAETAPTERTEP